MTLLKKALAFGLMTAACNRQELPETQAPVVEARKSIDLLAEWDRTQTVPVAEPILNAVPPAEVKVIETTEVSTVVDCEALRLEYGDEADLSDAGCVNIVIPFVEPCTKEIQAAVNDFKSGENGPLPTKIVACAELQAQKCDKLPVEQSIDYKLEGGERMGSSDVACARAELALCLAKPGKSYLELGGCRETYNAVCTAIATQGPK